MKDIALLIMRIVFAGSMLYGHGLGKFKKLLSGDLGFLNPIGIGEAPTLILAVFSEFLAPIFIILGYKTKFFSFFPAATMFVVTFIVHLGDPFGRIEKALLFLVGFVVIILMGPGKYSFDNKSYKEIISILTILFMVIYFMDQIILKWFE